MRKHLKKIDKNINKINDKNIKLRLKLINFWAKKALKTVEKE